MRRSSWAALGVGGAALGAAAFLYGTPASAVAPPMTNVLAAKIIRRGTEALAHRDTNGLLDLMAPNAKILDGRRSDLRYALDTTFQQMPGRLSVSVRAISARMAGAEAHVRCTADIGEHTGKMDAIYYPALTMDLKLMKVRSSHWLGLFQGEDWKITEVKTSQHIDLPQP